MIAHIALGSNLGDREARLELAVRELAQTPGITLLDVSSIYETAPVGPAGQGPYLNAVVRIECAQGPRALLERLLAIEALAGRDRLAESARWQARTLDLDLLLCGEECVDEPGLEVPHPLLHERAFVLEPLCEISPELVHPRLGEKISVLAERKRDPDAVWRWPRSLRGCGD